MKTRSRLIPLVAISLLLIAVSPAAYASTLKVTLNPATKTADLTSNSTTTLVLTYPSNSTLSKYLRNYTSSVSWSGSFRGSSDGTLALQGSLEEEDHDVHVQSMNVTYSLKATGNNTALVVNKETDVSAIVVGAFSVVNGTVHANLGWKAFSIHGQMILNLEDHQVDVNQVGSTFNTQLGDHPYLTASIFGMFGEYGLWHRSTLNFSALNTPLSTWTRNYDSLTNTTTYSKTINGESSLSVSADFNGQKYGMSIKSDPSAQVGVQGYAVASGDSLVIQPTPLLLTPAVWVGAAAVMIAVVGGALYMLKRSRAHVQTRVPSIPSQN
jgi:hypothetical protein